MLKGMKFEILGSKHFEPRAFNILGPYPRMLKAFDLKLPGRVPMDSKVQVRLFFELLVPN
jgi:hypothetical protein